MAMQDTTRSRASRPVVGSVAGMGRGMRVLVVDDVRDTLMTLGILLRSEGFDVRLQSGGLKVVDAVREFCPEAVLIDLGMPDRGGYAVSHQLTLELGSECPVLIAVTAHDTDADKPLAELSGFRHFVETPFDPDQLLPLLASLNPGP